MIAQPLSEKLAQFLRGSWTGSKRIQGVQGGARAYLLLSRRPMASGRCW